VLRNPFLFRPFRRFCSLCVSSAKICQEGIAMNVEDRSSILLRNKGSGMGSLTLKTWRKYGSES
jgi:hypothetical protein